MTDPNLTALHDAARAGDIETVRRLLDHGVDPDASDERGFTALHCAAIACNSGRDAGPGTAVIRLLLERGANPHVVGEDGRTPLYLAAEFSWSLEPVQVLVEAGASPDVTCVLGRHVVDNAMMPEVAQYLSGLTGHPVPAPRPSHDGGPLSLWQWTRVRSRIGKVFHALEKRGLVALQNVGADQDEGFEVCAVAFAERGGTTAGLTGACFYTEQDRIRARRHGVLPIAFWGAPDGNPDAMRRTGEQVVQALRDAGFQVEWNGSGEVRPVVRLKASQTAA